MKDPNEIRKLADKRLEEAELLFKHKYFDGAFYLAGYAVELYFKAKICELMDISNLYSQPPVVDTDLSRTFYTHKLSRLLLLSGLYTKFENEKANDKVLMADWSLVSTWDERKRYDSIGTNLEANVLQFLNSVKSIIQWIKQH